MLGAVVGDIIGSVYEGIRIKRKRFPLFTPISLYTDDTVLTVAIADAILTQRDYGALLKRYARRYPFRGYGPRFTVWMLSPFNRAYNSLGNGSAMRVSPIAYAFNDESIMLAEAAKTAACTHNHLEGIKGAQAVAHAIFMARHGQSKEIMRTTLTAHYQYDLTRTVESIRPAYRLNLTCPGSVPEAIIAFLDSTDFEDAIRNAVSLGGDADTQAAIAGAIAEAFYGGIPEALLKPAVKRLNRRFKRVLFAFYQQFGNDAMRAQAAVLL